jgi:hypothetical protein
MEPDSVSSSRSTNSVGMSGDDLGIAHLDSGQSSGVVKRTPKYEEPASFNFARNSSEVL